MSHPWEQLFWWAIALFGLGAGASAPDALFGAALNSCVLAAVTAMTEAKMIREWARARRERYLEHQKTTSVWLPWPVGWRPAERYVAQAAALAAAAAAIAPLVPDESGGARR